SWGEDEDGCAPLLALAQARLAFPGSEHPMRWLVVTRHAQAAHDGENLTPAPAALWGFVRTIQTEQPHWHVSLVDCADASLREPLLDELFAAELAPEGALPADGGGVGGLRPVEAKNSAHGAGPPACVLQIGQPGRVDSLHFSGCARPAPGIGEVEVEVAAAGLNF